MDDPKLHPGNEEKPGNAASPGGRAPAAGDSAAGDIRGNSNAPSGSGALASDFGATLADKSFTPVPRPGRSGNNARLQAGYVIGVRYEILKLLGEGGKGP